MPVAPLLALVVAHAIGSVRPAAHVIRRHCTVTAVSPVGESVGSGFPEADVAGVPEDLGGAVLNEEMKVTISYTGGAKGRTRRVRRARRPPLEERWRQQSDDLPPGYHRMSAYCNFGALNLEAAAEILAVDDRFRAFGDRLSVVSYADVVHCRFTAPESEGEGLDELDAFLFPYGSLLLWGFTGEEELRFLDLISPCSDPIPESGGTTADSLADFEFMLFCQPEESEDPEECSPPGSRQCNSALITNNVIALQTYDATERLAISFAFAQSAKLSVLEAALDETTEEIKDIPEQLVRTGRSRMTANQLARLTG